MKTARILGVGSFVPKRVVTNERIAKAIPGWSATKIEEKTGIRERRFLWDFNPETGQARVPPDDGSFWPRTNVDMCEIALRQAVLMAQVSPQELDALFVVTVSPDELNFCHDARVLHQRLGCRTDAYALVVDSGCGGALYLVDMVWKMIRGGQFKTVAIVASNFVSPYLDREIFSTEIADGREKPIKAFLTMYLFADGAGAMILGAEESEHRGILASTAGTGHDELVLRRGGGALRPPHPGRASPVDHACILDGRLVAECFPIYMRKCLAELFRPNPDLVPEVKRYYLHQSNKLLLEQLITTARLPRERIPLHIERYGNMSAASSMILLAEDLDRGVVELDSGDLVLLAAVGAGVHYGGQIVRL